MMEKIFENILWNSRLVVLSAVVTSLLAAIIGQSVFPLISGVDLQNFCFLTDMN